MRLTQHPAYQIYQKFSGRNNAVIDEERSIEERNEKRCCYSVDEIQNMMLEIFGI
jgi:hypothetical protein